MAGNGWRSHRIGGAKIKPNSDLTVPTHNASHAPPGPAQNVAIPTGIPLVYKFDRDLKPIKQEGCNEAAGMSGVFLEERGLLRVALEAEAEWIANVPGYEEAMTKRFV